MNSLINAGRIRIELEVYQDDAEVRGNAMCSGCDECDRRYEDEILERLNDGDVWAWATVRVVARYDGINSVYGDNYLGCCTYKDEDDFKRCGYYEDMVSEAESELIAKLEELADQYGPAILAVSPDEYVENEGADCPVCACGCIQTETPRVSGGNVYCECECCECGATWTDKYDIAGYLNLEGGAG